MSGGMWKVIKIKEGKIRVLKTKRRKEEAREKEATRKREK